MNKRIYKSPFVEALPFKVEAGFAATNDNGNNSIVIDFGDTDNTFGW